MHRVQLDLSDRKTHFIQQHLSGEKPWNSKAAAPSKTSKTPSQANHKQTVDTFTSQRKRTWKVSTTCLPYSPNRGRRNRARARHLEYPEASGDPATGLPIGKADNLLLIAGRPRVPTCTPVWPKPLAMKGSMRSLIGSRHLRKQNVLTPTVSKKPWITSTANRTCFGRAPKAANSRDLRLLPFPRRT